MDKISIKGFEVTAIKNYDSLIDRGIITVKDRQNNYICISGNLISTIKIGKTRYFDDFFYTLTQYGGVYGKMQLSINDEEYHNLNCYTIKEYIDKIEEAKEFLSDEYGITVNMRHIMYDSLEINKTIVINEKFSKYSRPLNLMMYLLPNKLQLKEVDYMGKSLQSKKVTDYKKKPETYMKISKGKTLSIKIYDKTEQLKNFKILVEHNYLRFEITLFGAKKIDEKLGTNNVWELTDEMVNQFFHEFIEKNVLEAYTKYCENRGPQLRKIIKENYKPKCSWTKNVLEQIANLEIDNGLPLVLDVNEIIQELDKVCKFSTRSSKYYARKTLQEKCEGKLKVLANQDYEKMLEIIEKLL